MKKIINKPLIVFAAGLLLLAGSTIGATSAAINYSSEQRTLDFKTASLDVEIREYSEGDYKVVDDANPIAFPGLQSDDFQIGKLTASDVRVANISGTDGFDEYIRVRVTKSWLNSEGDKDTLLNPDLIEMSIADGWTKVDADGTSPETATYYYRSPVANGQEIEVIEGITIRGELLEEYVIENTEVAGTVKTLYRYDGQSIDIVIKVDALQVHNPVEAIKGAWGLDAEVDEDGNISSINGTALR